MTQNKSGCDITIAQLDWDRALVWHFKEHATHAR